MFKILQGDCLEWLDDLEENSIDCIVTDPPYELNFMGKGWDNAGVSFKKETWQKCLRVLKPGGYLLAFGGTRTYHRITCAIEDAGFEIRDCVMWLYGSGFPKSHDIGLAIDKKLGNESKIIGEGRSGGTSRAYQSAATTTAGAYQLKEAQNEWKGWGSALKPAYEPILVARKPFKGSLVDNVMQQRIGGLNVDECRVPLENGETKHGGFGQAKTGFQKGIGNSGDKDYKCEWVENTQGRFPANVILDSNEGEEWRRYFYCAKASTKDRNEGLEISCPHPTVKPTALMQYLVRLVAPKGATILDPFMGSGSTGKAIAYENKERDMNYSFIGIEQDQEYCEIARKRIGYVIAR